MLFQRNGYLLFGTVEKKLELLAHLAAERLPKVSLRAVGVDHVVVWNENKNEIKKKKKLEEKITTQNVQQK